MSKPCPTCGATTLLPWFICEDPFHGTGTGHFQNDVIALHNAAITNRGCVNPSHLEQVTNKTNTLRGATIPARNANKDYCKRGHEFTYMKWKVAEKRYYRACRECDKENTATWQLKKRAALEGEQANKD